MFKKWWIWALVIVLLIGINLFIPSHSDDVETVENKPDLINGQLSTH